MYFITSVARLKVTIIFDHSLDVYSPLIFNYAYIFRSVSRRVLIFLIFLNGCGLFSAKLVIILKQSTQLGAV